jgi:hypothetical protein
MSRRRGQNGTVKIINGRGYGRYYENTPEGQKQKRVALGPCSTQSVGERKMREFIGRNGINSDLTFIRAECAALTVKDQAEICIGQLKTRRRKPVRRKTLECYKNAIYSHIVPCVGEVTLDEANNSAFKQLVAYMVAKRHSMTKACPEGVPYSAETINTVTKVFKEVVESLLDKNGDPVYPRKWNNDFADLPIIHKSEQKRPSMTVSELEQGLTQCKRMLWKFLFALLAATGLRIGEAFAIEAKHVSPDGRTIQNPAGARRKHRSPIYQNGARNTRR